MRCILAVIVGGLIVLAASAGAMTIKSANLVSPHESGKRGFVPLDRKIRSDMTHVIYVNDKDAGSIQ